MPKIEIDKDKCRNALECRKCLEVCQAGVFFAYPRKTRTSTARADDWVVEAALISYCDLCNLCVEACPQKAITILNRT